MCLQRKPLSLRFLLDLMLWLYRLQQSLSITRRESWALLSVLALFCIGLGVQEIQRRQTPPLPPDALLPPVAASPAIDSVATDSAATRPPTPDPAPADAPIDVNRASAVQLQTLPGIGPALASRIVAYRSRRPFRRVEDLQQVSGIGPKTLTALRPRVSVGPAE